MSFVKLSFMVERGMPVTLTPIPGRHASKKYGCTDAGLQLINDQCERGIESMMGSQLNDPEWLVNKNGYLIRTIFGVFTDDDIGCIELVRIDLKDWIKEAGAEALLALHMIPEWCYDDYVDAFPCLKPYIKSE